MTIAIERPGLVVHQGHCLDVLRGMPDESVHAVVTSPHIVSFAVRELRAEPTNLVLLCRTCHRFVHSRKNVAGEFIAEKGGDANGAGA